MENYIVSARKYRPSNFKSVVGQEALTNTLKNAIDSKKLAQAYLFCGPRGVGKTSCARIFAKTINCLSPTADGEACGHCDSCRAIDQGNSFNVVELDAASNNSVDQIRDLCDEVNIPPQMSEYKVFIIDEVHMLSAAAFNAFLKTLEEPPKYVIFILATTEKHKVIPTILSRCQIYDFKRITISDISRHLEYVASDRNVTAEKEALNVIARKADGAMRDALSIFDQVAASSAGNITYQSTIANLNFLDYEYYFRLVESFRAGNIADALLIFNEIKNKGFDIQFFINGLASHIRDLMVAAEPSTASLLDIGEEIVPRYVEQAKSLPIDWYYAAMRILNDADLNYRTATNKQLLTEISLIRLCQLLKPPTPPFDRVDAKIDLTSPAGPVVPSQPAPQAPTQHVVNPQKTVNTAASATSAAAGVSTAPAATAPVAPKTTAPAPKTSADTTAAAAPAKASAIPATEKKKTTRRRGATRLSDLEDEVKVKEEEKTRREALDVEGFSKAWNEYIDENPDKPILVAAMKSAVPNKVGDEEFLMLVDHPAQVQAFELNMNNLVGFLRKKLKNDFLSLKVEINKDIKVAKPLPNKELFKDILESNPVLANFMSQIDPEII